MAKYEILIPANTWTNVTSTVVAEVGEHLILRTDKTDAKLGRKATAPTDGPVMVAGEAMEVIIKRGDPLLLWLFSTTGGKFYAESAGAKRVVLDGTGTV